MRINSKTITYLVTLFFLIISILGTNIISGMASAAPQATPPPPGAPTKNVEPVIDPRGATPTPTPVPEIKTYQNSAVFDFRALGLNTFLLPYPSSNNFDMNLPNNWQLVGGQPAVNLDLPDPYKTLSKDAINFSYIDIHYDLTGDSPFLKDPTPGPGGKIGNYNNPAGPSVEVYVDDYLAGSFMPESGENHTYRVPFPPQAALARLYTPQNDHNIRIEYYRNMDNFCLYKGILKIYDDSSVRVSFVEKTPNLDLSAFPSPITQDSFIPETVFFIIPDDYNENDLSAAVLISATIGRKVNDAAKLQMVPASKATPELLKKANAVIIGTPEKNSFLQGLFSKGQLLSQYSGGSLMYGGRNLSADEGLLELTYATPDNLNAYLIITGTTDTAIKRAAQAIARPLLGQKGALIMVGASADVEAPKPPAPPNAFQLIDLGILKDRSFYGLGSYSMVINFYVPRDWELQEDIALVLRYDFSNNLSAKNSSISVDLNAQPIGTVPIDNTQGEKEAVIPFKKADLRPGLVNVLTLNLVIAAPVECAPYTPRGNWMRIRSSSLVNLPHNLITDPAKASNLLSPFYYLVYEQIILISLPPKPTSDELSGMVNLALIIGKQKKYQPYYNYLVSMDPKLDPAQYTTFNVVAIGKPSQNMLIKDLNDADVLPQSFVPGEDALKTSVGPADYRLPSNISIGVVEAIPAPWNPAQGVTIITGTTDEGLRYALQKFSDEKFVFNFTGDINFVSQDTIDSFISKVPQPPSLQAMVSNMTKTQPVLEAVVPTPTSGATSIAPDKYVRTNPEPANLMEKLGPILLGLIIGLGVLIAIIAVTATTRGGRKS